MDAASIVELAVAFGVGTLLNSVVNSLLGRRKTRVEITELAVGIAKDVLEQTKTELDETRQELHETRGELADARSELRKAHDEILDIRKQLTAALLELATYRANCAPTPTVGLEIKLPPNTELG